MCDFDGELKDLGAVREDRLAALERRLAERNDLWLAGNKAKPNRFGAFKGSTLHIVFQYPIDLRSHEHSEYSPLWESWREVVEPLIHDATTGRYPYRHGRTSRVMLARLVAGKSISRHVDNSPSAAVPHKLHVPVTTNPDVRFVIGGGTHRLERGRAYEVNNRRPHEVHNAGATDRVHLVFDYYDAERPAR